MFSRAKLLFSLILLSLVSFQAQAHHIVVKNAWIPEAPPVSKVLAAFMVINNSSDQAEEIVAIEGDDFDHVEMHLSQEVDGVAKMMPQKSLVIPAKNQLELKPGSYHLMLYTPKRSLKAGETSRLTLTLKSGKKFDIKAMVKKAGGMMMHNHDHH